MVGMLFGHVFHPQDSTIPGPHDPFPAHDHTPAPETPGGPGHHGHDHGTSDQTSPGRHPDPTASLSKSLAEQTLKRLKPEDWIARVFKLRRKARARFMVAGAAVLLLGWFLPWHVIVFDPTTAGARGAIDVGSSNSLTVNGRVIHQFSHWYNGAAEAAAPTAAPIHISAAVMYVTTIALLLTALLTVLATQKNPSWTVRRGLASLGSVIPLIQLAVFVRQLPRSWAMTPLLNANVHAFLATYGKSPQALAAARHLSAHIFIGYYVLLFGILLAVLGTMSGQKPEQQADGTVLIATQDRAGTGKSVHKAINLLLKLSTVVLLFSAAVELATHFSS
ncbi:hypothetical protein [Actinospica robiniae]|uniref:hypothetical protein n=1 Tax=Actinospica robiniae TaxID=304901 RepID=UPI0003F913A4|nr:hypothetical protein [Actinospica robiniae]